ncbi:MAG: DUF4304 domain-containing protein [Opitutae bacterium]|nr:DUF4304 domain-containing protein [Opitutae bacterium]
MGRLWKKLSDRLRQLGFRVKGLVFKQDVSGNLLLIDIQKSRDQAPGSTRFTMNFGVVSRRLFDRTFQDIESVLVHDAHLNVRAGWFLPDHPDKWWEIEDEASAQPLIEELDSLLVRAAVPYLQSHASDEALVRLWRQGEGPGLTELQRRRLFDQANALGL